MIPDENGRPVEPWQACWQCGMNLWDWSTAYETTNFLGRIVLCRFCANHVRDVKPVTERAGLLGSRDKANWQRIRKGKR